LPNAAVHLTPRTAAALARQVLGKKIQSEDGVLNAINTI